MTKKYAGVYPPLVERLLTEEGQRKDPQKAKAVKTKLHQIYGAYTQDNGHKKAAKLLDELAEENVTQTAKSLLALHASTKERLPHYFEFYSFIQDHTGPIESILDIGCGYNPFSIPLIPLIPLMPLDHNAELKSYHAYDIDTRVTELLNRFFTALGLPPLAACADLALHTPQDSADIALICKLIPVLEAQSPGSGFRLARGLNARYLLITYPLKSLGGREKGMAQNYTTTFERALAQGELGRFMLMDKGQVGQEMLYMMKQP